jgi:hypothetical protein
MIRIKKKCDIAVPKQSFSPGDVVELHHAIESAWVSKGYAEYTTKKEAKKKSK